MDFNYQDLDDENWNTLRKNLSEYGLFGSVNFLKAMSDAYQLNYKLCGVFHKNKPVILLSYFTNGKNIVSPNNYYYEYIWFDKKGSGTSWVWTEAMSFLLRNLQQNYTDIYFRLPADVVDLRPFLWNDFKAEIRYTYIKALSDLTYHQNINRIIKKESDHFSFKINEDWSLVWQHHARDLRRFKIKEKQIEQCLDYFKKIKTSDNVESYNLYINGTFVSSIIVLMDKLTQKAYFPLIGTVDSFYKDGAAVKLYDYTLKQLSLKGFETVDFLGANISSIARFKQKFYPNLVCYHEVKYVKNQVSYQKIKRRLINAIRKSD